MMSAWFAIAVLSVGVAALLALADGALLATGHSAPRALMGDPERAHRALALGRVLAHLLTGTAVALATTRLGVRSAVAITLAALLVLVNVVLVEGAASAKELQKANVSSWEHGLIREADGALAQLKGSYLVARGEADAPDIDGRVYVRGKLPVGEFARVRVIGHTDYDLIAEVA